MTSIVLADDHPVVRQGLRALLEAETDFRLIGEAGDGLEAVQLAERLCPNVLVLDLMMPGMTGFEVVQRLREDPATSGIPILICTAKTLTAPERELLSRQVESIIEKGSFETEDLLQMMATLRNRQRGAPQSP